MKALWIALLGTTLATSAMAQIRITEWMYGGANGEFIEFTNVGTSSVNMNGWSFDDDSRLVNTVSLSAFGVVAPGESVILTEAVADTFRTSWSLPASVKVIGGNATNLGRNDEINIYNSLGDLADRFSFGDQTFAGSIRTLNFSGNIAFADLGQNKPLLAVLSSVGDTYGSYTSTGTPPAVDVANPGKYAPVPEPATLAVLGLGASALLRRKRK